MKNVLPAAALVAAALTNTSAGRATGDSITVNISGLRSQKGQVGCALFASADGFPTHAEKAAARQFVKIASAKTATCFFDGVKPGDVAIAVIHDENENGKLDRNILGIPIEGYGASRDARRKLGPPSFSDASFKFAGRAAQTPVIVHY